MFSSEFVDRLWADWLPGAMYPSEMVWLGQQLLAHEVEVLIECGRQDGVSTRCFGEMLAPTGAAIYSIDFDADRDRLEKVRASLSGKNVTCVSGDIHRHVPRLLAELKGRRIAVLQDGPKGWEGLSTLVPAAFNDDVVLLAQHNLHEGHHSRSYFSLMACNAPFLEFDTDAVQARELRARERTDAAFRRSNREVDHSSLGICSLDGPVRQAVQANIRALDRDMGPWSALRTGQHWQAGDLEHVSRLRKRQRWSWYRFKAR